MPSAGLGEGARWDFSQERYARLPGSPAERGEGTEKTFGIIERRRSRHGILIRTAHPSQVGDAILVRRGLISLFW